MPGEKIKRELWTPAHTEGLKGLGSALLKDWQDFGEAAGNVAEHPAVSIPATLLDLTHGKMPDLSKVQEMGPSIAALVPLLRKAVIGKDLRLTERLKRFMDRLEKYGESYKPTVTLDTGKRSQFDSEVQNIITAWKMWEKEHPELSQLIGKISLEPRNPEAAASFYQRREAGTPLEMGNHIAIRPLPGGIKPTDRLRSYLESLYHEAGYHAGQTAQGYDFYKSKESPFFGGKIMYENLPYEQMPRDASAWRAERLMKKSGYKFTPRTAGKVHPNMEWEAFTPEMLQATLNGAPESGPLSRQNMMERLSTNQVKSLTNTIEQRERQSELARESSTMGRMAAQIPKYIVEYDNRGRAVKKINHQWLAKNPAQAEKEGYVHDPIAGQFIRLDEAFSVQPKAPLHEQLMKLRDKFDPNYPAEPFPGTTFEEANPHRLADEYKRRTFSKIKQLLSGIKPGLDYNDPVLQDIMNMRRDEVFNTIGKAQPGEFPQVTKTREELLRLAKEFLDEGR